MRAAKVLVAIAVAAVLGGCSTLPSSGPVAVEVAQQASNAIPEATGFVVVDIDERVTAISAAQPRESFRSVFRDVRPAPDLRIGVGDSVVVTIWEAAGGGLFSAGGMDRSVASGSRTAAIPEQVVARDGTIQVPYAGRLRVAGMRLADVEQTIVRALTGKAIEPQVVVTISRNLSNTVTVGGEVAQSSRVPLSTKGDRILDAIAGAGGLRVSTHEAFIRLTRGGHTVSVAYTVLLNRPEENIFIIPGDTLTVVREPQTFTAFGSTGRNAAVPFESTGITLEEAIAKAGGLVDSQADPAGIFLLRFEPSRLVHELLPGQPMPSEGALIPVVYRLNLRQMNSFFLARAFPVKDKDILYVANSPIDPVQKFLRLVGTLTSPAATGVGIYYNVTR